MHSGLNPTGRDWLHIASTREETVEKTPLRFGKVKTRDEGCWVISDVGFYRRSVSQDSVHNLFTEDIVSVDHIGRQDFRQYARCLKMSE